MRDLSLAVVTVIMETNTRLPLGALTKNNNQGSTVLIIVVYINY